MTLPRIVLAASVAGLVIWAVGPHHQPEPIKPCTQTWVSPQGSDHDITFPVERNADGSCP